MTGGPAAWLRRSFPSLVMKIAKRAGVKLILQESFYPAKITKMIAKKTGTRLVRIEAAPHFKAGETYEAHMNNIVRALVKASKK